MRNFGVVVCPIVPCFQNQGTMQLSMKSRLAELETLYQLFMVSQYILNAFVLICTSHLSGNGLNMLHASLPTHMAACWLSHPMSILDAVPRTVQW